MRIIPDLGQTLAVADNWFACGGKSTNQQDIHTKTTSKTTSTTLGFTTCKTHLVDGLHSHALGGVACRWGCSRRRPCPCLCQRSCSAQRPRNQSPPESRPIQLHRPPKTQAHGHHELGWLPSRWVTLGDLAVAHQHSPCLGALGCLCLCQWVQGVHVESGAEGEGGASKGADGL